MEIYEFLGLMLTVITLTLWWDARHE